MTADARRHHPAAEKTPKFPLRAHRHHQTWLTVTAAPPSPAAHVPTRLWVALAVVVTLLAGAFVFGFRRMPPHAQRPRHGVHAGESR